MLLNPRLQGMAEQARAGELTAAQFAQEIQRTAELAQARGKQDKWLASILDVQGNSILAATTQMARYTDFGEKFNQTQLEQQKMVESNDKAMGGLNQSWQRLKNSLIQMLLPAIEKAAGWIDTMAAKIEGFTRGELAETIKEYGGLITTIGLVGGALIGLKVAVVAAKVAMQGIRAIGAMGGTGAVNRVAGTTAMRAAGTAPAQVALGGLAIGAGVGGGMALAGAGIGAGAWLAGKGLKSVGKGLQEFNEVDSTNMKSIAIAIGNMTSSVTGLATDGGFAVLAKDMPKFSKSLKSSMKEIDTGALIKYANAIDGLGDAFGNLKNNMGGAISASGKSTGDKLDTLNSTMIQVLNVLTHSDDTLIKIRRKDYTGNLQIT